MLIALALAASAALPFIEDDYPRALAQARAEHKPLFIDFWATWCHTCLSMRSTVMEDPGLRPVAGAVVWASIETEAEKNKDVVDKYPLDAWPTFVLVNPDDETVIARWLGAASVSDFRAFVRNGATAYRSRMKGASPAAAAQRKGDEARLSGDLPASAAAYARAVQLSKPKDPQRPERLALYANALRKLHTKAAGRTCIALAQRELNHTGDTAIATDFIGYATSCAGDLPRGDPAVAKLTAAAIERLQKLLAVKDAPLSADDRSDALANLAELLDDKGRHDDAVAAMKTRAAVLEEAAGKAADATAAATYDPHRVDTYLFLGEPQKAEALLVAREKELPADYNPAARLARVLLEEKKLPEAEAAVDRALAKMTRGQRRVGILGLKAKILAAEKKPAKDVVREQLEVLRALPKSQRNPQQEAKLSAQLQ